MLVFVIPLGLASLLNPGQAQLNVGGGAAAASSSAAFCQEWARSAGQLCGAGGPAPSARVASFCRAYRQRCLAQRRPNNNAVANQGTRSADFCPRWAAQNAYFCAPGRVVAGRSESFCKSYARRCGPSNEAVCKRCATDRFARHPTCLRLQPKCQAARALETEAATKSAASGASSKSGSAESEFTDSSEMDEEDLPGDSDEDFGSFEDMDKSGEELLTAAPTTTTTTTPLPAPLLSQTAWCRAESQRSFRLCGDAQLRRRNAAYCRNFDSRCLLAPGISRPALGLADKMSVNPLRAGPLGQGSVLNGGGGGGLFGGGSTLLGGANPAPGQGPGSFWGAPWEGQAPAQPGLLGALGTPIQSGNAEGLGPFWQQGAGSKVDWMGGNYGKGEGWSVPFLGLNYNKGSYVNTPGVGNILGSLG